MVYVGSGDSLILLVVVVISNVGLVLLVSSVIMCEWFYVRCVGLWLGLLKSGCFLGVLVLVFFIEIDSVLRLNSVLDNVLVLLCVILSMYLWYIICCYFWLFFVVLDGVLDSGCWCCFL